METPKFIEPMQCKAVTKLPEETTWTFEIKFDGYRCIAVKDDDEVSLFSRNENVLNARFPNVVAALRELPGSFTLDGEIVALDEQGRPSFQLLQNNVSRPLAVFYYVFDLLHHDGEHLTRLPIERRRVLLKQLLSSPARPVTSFATPRGYTATGSRGCPQTQPRGRGREARWLSL